MTMRNVYAGFLILGMAVLVFGCGGTLDNGSDVKLGIPYRAQPVGSLWCGPTSVLMWRLYDRLPEISLETIANWMGGASCGAFPEDIAAAVNHFTNTSDAYWDLEGSLDQDEFMSRQITSIDSGVPVIAIVNAGLHAGVVNGGKWRELSNGLYEWDYVYFHDPQIGPNRYYVAADWIDYSCASGTPCSQIVSFSASASWGTNLSAHYDDGQVLGWPPGPYGDCIYNPCFSSLEESPKENSLIQPSRVENSDLSDGLWNLVACEANQKTHWQEFAAMLTSAEPGSSLYVPNPFPETSREVVENFVEQHSRVWSDVPRENLNAEEGRFFKVIDGGRGRFEVTRVANWTPLRCGKWRQRNSYFLVRLFDRLTGEEITRAAVTDDGLLSTLQHRPADQSLSQYPPAFASLDQGVQRAISSLESEAEDAQYVFAFGTLRCEVLAPCIAFRSEGQVYVFESTEDGVLYRLAGEDRRVSFQQNPASPQKLLDLRSEANELLSLGGDVLGQAVPVDR